jgi:hypothetical protein
MHVKFDVKFVNPVSAPMLLRTPNGMEHPTSTNTRDYGLPHALL